MSLDQFKHILDQLKGKTEYIYYHLMGEPLLHPSISLFIEEASKRGFKSMITTNGTLLEENESMLLRLKLHKINISVHSFEDNDEVLQLNYLNQISSFANKASEYGTIVVLRLWNNGFAKDKNDKTISFLKEYFGTDWKQNSRGFTIKNKLFLEFGERFEWPDLNSGVKGNSFFCYGLRDHFGILTDGTVVPCCLDSEGVLSLGNIFEKDLSCILNSPRARSIYDGFSQRKANEELCRKCGYAQRFI